MSIRKGKPLIKKNLSPNPSPKTKKSIGKKISVGFRKGWDFTMQKTQMKKILRKIDALQDWEQPQNVNEALTSDIISAIPFIGLTRAFEQFGEEKNAMTVLDGASEFISIGGATIAAVFPSNTIIYMKKEHLPDGLKHKLRYI